MLESARSSSLFEAPGLENARSYASNVLECRPCSGARRAEDVSKQLSKKLRSSAKPLGSKPLGSKRLSWE